MKVLRRLYMIKIISLTNFKNRNIGIIKWIKNHIFSKFCNKKGNIESNWKEIYHHIFFLDGIDPQKFA